MSLRKECALTPANSSYFFFFNCQILFLTIPPTHLETFDHCKIPVNSATQKVTVTLHDQVHIILLFASSCPTKSKALSHLMCLHVSFERMVRYRSVKSLPNRFTEGNLLTTKKIRWSRQFQHKWLKAIRVNFWYVLAHFRMIQFELVIMLYKRGVLTFRKYSIVRDKILAWILTINFGLHAKQVSHKLAHKSG